MKRDLSRLRPTFIDAREGRRRLRPGLLLVAGLVPLLLAAGCDGGAEPSAPVERVSSALDIHWQPSLRDLRAAQRKAAVVAGAEEGPTPGGLGVGIGYQLGRLQITRSATLDTSMIVYPRGVGDLQNWLFTTATNRTDNGVEVVGIYLVGGTGDIGVFDWSCAPGFPCRNGETQPSWVWTQPFTTQPCWYGPQDNGTGRVHDVLRYRNNTQLSNGLWHNQVSFWNRCFSRWDVVYDHDYVEQNDCSLDNGCGWWGPILETFFPDGDPNWPIPELGFFATTLEHDGIVSSLGPTETDWFAPGPTWNTCYRSPNSAWSAGTGSFCPAISEAFASSAGSFIPVDGTWAVSSGAYRITTPRTGSSTLLNNHSVHQTYLSGDFTLTATGNAVSTSATTDNFAVLFDWNGPGDYYYASFAESNSSSLSGIFRVQAGVQTQLADISSNISPGTTYRVRVERSDRSIKVYRNDALVASASDGAFTAGQVGFGSRNSRAVFDNLVVNTTKINEHFAFDNGRFVPFDGSWLVSGGTYTISGANTVPTSTLNNLSLHRWPSYGDFTFNATARATATSGTSDNFAVVFGWLDPSNYYYARFDESGDVYRRGIFRVINGIPTQLAFIYSTIVPNTSYAIRVERAGSYIRVYRNGVLEATTPDTALVDGKVGFGSRSSQATFDDLVVY